MGNTITNFKGVVYLLIRFFVCVEHMEVQNMLRKMIQWPIEVLQIMEEEYMRRKTIAMILSVCICAGMLFTACGQNTGADEGGEISTETTENDISPAVTFVDDLGREVTVKNPKRVAALLGSYAHIWHLAGGIVAASADDAWEDFDIPLADDAVNLGGTKDLNLEKLFEANPDFVIASSNTTQHVEWLDTLENANVNVAYFEVSDFNDYLHVLEICTNITGRADLYDENGSNISEEIQGIIKSSQNRIETKGESPKVLSLRASATWIRAKNSEGNVLGEMLKDLGLVPGSGRSPGGGHGKPLQCSCLENPRDRGAWQAPWGCKVSEMTEAT